MSLHFTVRGAGAPLVVVHGLFGSLENLGGIARLLKDTFRVYSLDLPHHGRSPHDGDFSLSGLSSALREWALEQGLEKAHWLGHSLGGKAVMELALRYPELVNTLVVLDIAPLAYGNRHADIFRGLLAVPLASIETRNDADEILRRYVAEDAVRSFLLKNLQKDADGRFSWRINLQEIIDSYTQVIQANSRGRFDGRVLFLKGENSTYIDESQKPEVLARFPRAQLKTVAGTDHWLHAEKPALVASLINKFLNSEQ